MKKILLSTAYLGNIYYYKQLASENEVIIEQHEHYIKQSYRNRCTILGTNGVLDLTIPTIKQSGTKTVITDIEISYDTNWNKIHWQSIVSAYNSSPFFEYYRDEFEKLILSKESNLFTFNTNLQNLCITLLQITPLIMHNSEFVPISSESLFYDLRYSLSPKNNVDAQEFKPYHQVFDNKFGFSPNLSILDLLFNEGTNAISFLKS